MHLTDKEIDQLEAYWNDKLDKAAREQLEKRMASDPQFNMAAESWRQIIQEGFQPTSEELVFREKIKSQLHAFEKKMNGSDEPGDPGVGNRNPWILWIAAAATFLLILYFVGGRLFQRNSTLIADMEVPGRENATLSHERTAGEEAYDAQQYGQAWRLLKEEVATSEDSLKLLYAGIAALKAGEPGEATPLLQSISESLEWEDYHEAIWYYLAIAYAENDQISKALNLLEQVVEKNGPYKQKANKIINELEGQVDE